MSDDLLVHPDMLRNAQNLDRPAVRPRRKAPCWCGSGKRYKRCHYEADETVSRLPKMSTVLQRLADDLIQTSDGRLDSIQSVVRLTAIAWNISRSSEEEARQTLQGIEDDPEAPPELSQVLRVLVERARSVRGDPRIVAEVSVERKGPKLFDIHATALLRGPSLG